MNMKKVIVIIISIGIVLALGVLGFNILSKWLSQYNSTYLPEEEEESGYEAPQRVVTGIKQDITVVGTVEFNHNGLIYLFNGQHFGEYGMEMKEYTSVNITNKGQECIDYYTNEKYNVEDIEEGDILVCTGDLIKYQTINDFDTKENPIRVLKLADYNKLKKQAIEAGKEITVYDYFDTEIYLKYDLFEGDYAIPFGAKCKITEDTKITGNLEKGVKVQVQYKDTNVSFDELEIKSIKAID